MNMIRNNITSERADVFVILFTMKGCTACHLLQTRMNEALRPAIVREDVAFAISSDIQSIMMDTLQRRFRLSIENFESFPSVILMQRHRDKEKGTAEWSGYKIQWSDPKAGLTPEERADLRMSDITNAIEKAIWLRNARNARDARRDFSFSDH